MMRIKIRLSLEKNICKGHLRRTEFVDEQNNGREQNNHSRTREIMKQNLATMAECHRTTEMQYCFRWMKNYF